jgi:hypothetical protein
MAIEIQQDCGATLYKFTVLDEHVEISCESAVSDCSHKLESRDYSAFCLALGQPSDSPIAAAIRGSVKTASCNQVGQAIHALAKTTFAWSDYF